MLILSTKTQHKLLFEHDRIFRKVLGQDNPGEHQDNHLQSDRIIALEKLGKLELTKLILHLSSRPVSLPTKLISG